MAEFVFQMIKARKSYGDRAILDDVTLSFPARREDRRRGPERYGKSTPAEDYGRPGDREQRRGHADPGFTVGILRQEPPLDDTKTVGEEHQDGVRPGLPRRSPDSMKSVRRCEYNPDADF